MRKTKWSPRSAAAASSKSSVVWSSSACQSTSMSRVVRATLSRRSSRANPPLSTHPSGAIFARRSKNRSNVTRLRHLASRAASTLCSRRWRGSSALLESRTERLVILVRQAIFETALLRRSWSAFEPCAARFLTLRSVVRPRASACDNASSDCSVTPCAARLSSSVLSTEVIGMPSRRSRSVAGTPPST